MLEFKSFTPEAMVEVQPLLRCQTARSCDYTIGGLYMWRDFFNEKYAIVNGMLVCVVDYLDIGACYTLPIGAGSVVDTLSYIKEDAESKKIPLRFCCIPDSAVGLLSEALGPPKEDVEFRDWADYLYMHSNFCSYSGKKLATPRNHCNRFIREYPTYSYVNLNPQNIDVAIAFLKSNFSTFVKNSPIAIEEYERSVEILKHYELFGFVGGLLYVDNKLVGLTVGELIGDTLYVHIEKALKEYNGAFPMLASLFAKQTKTMGIEFINREDDSGDEGMRKSKLSYRPCEIIMKHVLVF